MRDHGRNVANAGWDEGEMFVGVSNLVEGPEGIIPSFVSLAPLKERTDFRWQILASAGRVVPEISFGEPKGKFDRFQGRAFGGDGGGVTSLVKDGAKIVNGVKKDAWQHVRQWPNELDLVNILSGLRIFIDDVGPCVSVDKAIGDSIEVVDVMLCARESKASAIEQISHDQQIRSDERPRVSAGTQDHAEFAAEASFGNEDRAAQRPIPDEETGSEEEIGLCRAWVEACDEVLRRRKSQQQFFQDETGVIVERTLGQSADFPLRSHDGADRLELVEKPLPDEGFHEGR